jgi:L-alanine-DL-glutamate epimerase-like enolase superfamily enzyme
MPLLCDVAIERWPLAEPFEIAREVLTDIDTICVRLTDAQGRVGRGEAVGVTYDGETPATLQAQIRSIGSSLPDDLGFDDLTSVLPPGGARNALDCALWDLRARQASRRFWTLAGWHVVQPVTTVYTIGLGSETQVRRWVRAARHLPVLKLKADGLRHLDMVRIAREEHPTARLLIDANQAWSPDLLERLLPALHAAGVELIEQPLPRGQDEALDGLCSPIPLAADESCTDAASLQALVGRYQFANIKLDKCGGLSEALAMVRRAQVLGLKLMVGSMGGTSLGVAPAWLVAQVCTYVDLDAPLLLARDRHGGLQYDGALVPEPSVEFWG